MIQLLCDDCRRPIDPQKDNHLAVTELIICHSQKVGRFNLRFCQRDHFISWLKKNGEPSAIISASNPKGPAL